VPVPSRCSKGLWVCFWSCRAACALYLGHTIHVLQEQVLTSINQYVELRIYKHDLDLQIRTDLQTNFTTVDQRMTRYLTEVTTREQCCTVHEALQHKLDCNKLCDGLISECAVLYMPSFQLP
jgi:UDP-galactopyranose mutase